MCLVNGVVLVWLFFFKQKTAYEMRISDWSSDVCSSDLDDVPAGASLSSSWLRDAMTQALPASMSGGTAKSSVFVGACSDGDQHFEQNLVVEGFARRKIGRASCRERVCQSV